jgi:hypothetical protein
VAAVRTEPEPGWIAGHVGVFAPIEQNAVTMFVVEGPELIEYAVVRDIPEIPLHMDLTIGQDDLGFPTPAESTFLATSFQTCLYPLQILLIGRSS